jgi:HSP20 family protein
MAMLMRYDPMREMMSLRDVMDRLFQEAMVAPQMLAASAGAGVAPMDVRETEDAYEVSVALPGWRPEEISVTIQENTVTISGQRNEEDEERDKKGRTYHVRERQFVSFSRSFTFPTPVDTSKAEARFENGELTLRLPKAESARPRQIRIGARSGAAGKDQGAGGQGAGQATGQGAGQSTGQGAGQSTGQGAGQSTGQGAGQAEAKAGGARGAS